MDPRSLALARIQDCPRLGPASLTRILTHFRGSIPDDVYGKPEDWYSRVLGLPKAAAHALAAYQPPVRPQYEHLAIRSCCFLDGEYPITFGALPAPPPVVHRFGAAEGLTCGSFAVLCSAGWEIEHPDVVKRAIEAGIGAGLRVVAGHNRPVFQWAILAAKRNSRASTMVLDRGLLCAFDADMKRDPIAAARIWGYGFDEDRCLALSSFRLHDGWTVGHSVLRDSMICALADIIVVVGMRPQGRIHMACRDALTRGQLVLADAEAHSLLGEHGAQAWEGTFPE